MLPRLPANLYTTRWPIVNLWQEVFREIFGGSEVKRHKRAIAAIFWISFLLTAPIEADSEGWNKEQREIWSNIEHYTGLVASGDIDGFLEYYHDDFTGWIPHGYLPDDKTQRSKLVRYYFEPKENGIPVWGKQLLSVKKPISIRVFDDIAVVHYTQEDLKTTDGKNEVTERTAWTDILKKDGDRWVMIADHGQNIGAETGGQ